MDKYAGKVEENQDGKIAENLRGYNVINPITTSTFNNTAHSTKDIPIEPKEEIDESQIDELDRLLSLTAIDE